jgi:four helix bundle protein
MTDDRWPMTGSLRASRRLAGRKYHEYRMHIGWTRSKFEVTAEGKMFTSFRKLDVWNRAMQLVDEVYELAHKLPRSEQFVLQAQILRSAISVPSNIAEGAGRIHLGDYVHHLSISRGSLAELETQLEIAVRRRYITHDECQHTFASSIAVGQMLNKLIGSLEHSRKKVGSDR